MLAGPFPAAPAAFNSPARRRESAPPSRSHSSQLVGDGRHQSKGLTDSPDGSRRQIGPALASNDRLARTAREHCEFLLTEGTAMPSFLEMRNFQTDSSSLSARTDLDLES